MTVDAQMQQSYTVKALPTANVAAAAPAAL
jgi:hypothetical protein